MDTLKDTNSENGRVHPIVTIFGPRVLAYADAALVRMFSISAHYVTACWGLRERFHPTLGLHARARLGENHIQITVEPLYKGDSEIRDTSLMRTLSAVPTT